jgi:hypothetical protein
MLEQIQIRCSAPASVVGFVSYQGAEMLAAPLGPSDYRGGLRREPSDALGCLGGFMRRHHDMGGEPAGPVDRHEHDQAPWEKKVDAILRLLLARRILTLDELRRGVEELGPGAYDELSYYERWIASISNLLLEKGILQVHELGVAKAAAQQRHAAAAAR